MTKLEEGDLYLGRLSVLPERAAKGWPRASSRPSRTRLGVAACPACGSASGSC